MSLPVHVDGGLLWVTAMLQVLLNERACCTADNVYGVLPVTAAKKASV